MVSSSPQKFADAALQFLVNLLRAADEAHRRQPVAPTVQSLSRGPDHLRMVRQVPDSCWRRS